MSFGRLIIHHCYPSDFYHDSKYPSIANLNCEGAGKKLFGISVTFESSYCAICIKKQGFQFYHGSLGN